MTRLLPPNPYPQTSLLPDGGFRLLAPAKINLGLRVLGRRPDGYHDLDTLFQEIGLADELEFYPSADWSLKAVAVELDTGPDNLISRAADRLSREAGVPCHARIVVHKKIPLCGGLGGGSSDAAITLHGLSRLWGLNWPVTRLHALAAELGADCAFFLYGGLARGSGRGERLELLEGRLPGEVLLVIPPFGVSTAWAFSAGRFPLTDDEKSVILEFCFKDATGDSRPRQIFSNDLENIVLSKYPALGSIKHRLLESKARIAMLSGSGSTLYGIFDQRHQALLAAQHFGPPFTIQVCPTVQRTRTI